MRMKALDQVHISSVGPNTIAKGEEFDVSASLAKDLEKRGLAVRVGNEDQAAATDGAKAGAEAETEGAAEGEAADPKAARTARAKAEADPLNKAEKAPANKAASTDADKTIGSNSIHRKRDRV